MTEEEISEPTTHIRRPKRITRILILLTAMFLLILSLFLVMTASQRVHPTSNSNIPPTPSITPFYLDTPPPQAEFYDTFKNNAQNWSVSNTLGFVRMIHPGRLTLANTNRGTTLIESLPTNSIFANCTAIVDITMLKVGRDDSVGIFIRGDTNLEHDYRLDVYGNGNFDLAKEYLDAENIPQLLILARSNIRTILKPPGEHNTISISMDGANLRLFINNVRVSSVSDSEYVSGQIALFAQLGRNSQEVTVSFSRVEIDKITGTLSGG